MLPRCSSRQYPQRCVCRGLGCHDSFTLEKRHVQVLRYADHAFIVLSSSVARRSRRWSCRYLKLPRHALLHRHRAPDAAPEVSPRSIDREVVGEAVVVAPDEDILPEPEDRDVAAHGGVVEACLPWSDLRPSCQDLRDDLRHQYRYMSVLNSKGGCCGIVLGRFGRRVCLCLCLLRVWRKRPSWEGSGGSKGQTYK
jgi:hypothetical protein